MKVTLIGIGGGGRDSLTLGAMHALQEAQLIVGAGRVLEGLPGTGAEIVRAYLPDEILGILKSRTPEVACVVYSGDSGFYSGASSLLPMLQEAGYEAALLPGISSLQLLSAALGTPWQDWRLVSAHGRDCDPVWEVMQGKPVLFLTAGAETVRDICNALTAAGLGGLKLTLGENLSYENQRIITGTARELRETAAAKLNVLLAEPAPALPRRTHGLPDDLFLRDKVPMTKQEVRSVILSKLAVRPEETCWDIGAGTGSVSVELSRVCRSVWAVEQKPEACALIGRNREKLCAWNLRLVEGTAPEVLPALPVPDAVFIGGSGGRLDKIVQEACRRNPAVRICISAIALETLEGAIHALEQQGYSPAVTQVAVSRTKAVGGLHLLTAQNPIFLVTGEQP